MKWLLVTICTILYLIENSVGQSQECSGGIQKCVGQMMNFVSTAAGDEEKACQGWKALSECVRETKCDQSMWEKMLKDAQTQFNKEGFKCAPAKTNNKSTTTSIGSFPVATLVMVVVVYFSSAF